MPRTSTPKTPEKAPAKSLKSEPKKQKPTSNKRLVKGVESANKSSTPESQLGWRRRAIYSFLAIVLGVGLFIGAQFLAPILFFIFGLILGFSINAIQSGFEQNSWMVVAAYTLSSLIIVFVVASLFRLRIRRMLRFVGLGSWPRWGDLVFGSLGYSMYMLFFFLFAYTVLPLLEDVVDSSQQQDLGLSSADTGLPVLFILLAIIPPLIEEFVFRGVIFQTIKRWMPFWLATILVSLVFGAMHLELINSSAPPNWIAMIDTTVLSVFMIFAMQKTKSLWTPIFIHFIKNTLAFTLLFLLN